MPIPEIVIRTFSDYTSTVVDKGEIVPNLYYPNHTYWAHDDMGSLVDPGEVVVHSMYVPAAQSKTGADSWDPVVAKNYLEELGLSVHDFIPHSEVDEKGRPVVYRMTQHQRKAWHAGESVLPNLKEGEKARSLNHSSIGIELLAPPDAEFTDQQYIALVGLVAQILIANPTIENILGHSEVSGPDVRKDFKVDPVNFDWNRFMAMLADALGVEEQEVARFRSRVT